MPVPVPMPQLVVESVNDVELKMLAGSPSCWLHKPLGRRASRQ